MSRHRNIRNMNIDGMDICIDPRLLLNAFIEELQADYISEEEETMTPEEQGDLVILYMPDHKLTWNI